MNTQSDWILVPGGGGAAQHFTDVQHVKFAMTLTHPLVLNANLNTSEEWLSAVKFETKSCRKVDAVRLQFVVVIQDVARQLEPERTQWLLLVPVSGRQMMENKGFGSIGHLGNSVVEMEQVDDEPPTKEICEVRTDRVRNNLMVLSKLKDEGEGTSIHKQLWPTQSKAG